MSSIFIFCQLKLSRFISRLFFVWNFWIDVILCFPSLFSKLLVANHNDLHYSSKRKAFFHELRKVPTKKACEIESWAVDSPCKVFMLFLRRKTVRWIIKFSKPWWNNFLLSISRSRNRNFSNLEMDIFPTQILTGPWVNLRILERISVKRCGKVFKTLAGIQLFSSWKNIYVVTQWIQLDVLFFYEWQFLTPRTAPKARIILSVQFEHQKAIPRTSEPIWKRAATWRNQMTTYSKWIGSSSTI